MELHTLPRWYDPNTRAPLTHNPNNGLAFPHVGKPPAEMQKVLPPHLIHQFVEAARAAQSGGATTMPPAAPLAPSPGSTAAKAAKAAKPVAPSLKSTHEFEVNGLKIRLAEAFTDYDEEGVATPIRIKPAAFKEVETFYVRYLKENPDLIPKDASKVVKIGLLQKGSDYVLEVHYAQDGIYRSVQATVKPEDHPLVVDLSKKYPGLIIQETSQLPSFERSYNPYTAKADHPLRRTIQGMLTATNYNSAYAMGVHSKAMAEAKKRLEHSEVEYCYPQSLTSLQRQFPDMVTSILQRTLLDAPTARVVEEGSKRLNHHVYMYSAVGLRQGRHPDEMTHEQHYEFAQLHPLHFCINANLGRLESTLGPRLQHHQEAVISTKSRGWFSSKRETVFIQDGLEMIEYDPANPGKAHNDLVQAVLRQLNRLNEIHKKKQLANTLKLSYAID